MGFLHRFPHQTGFGNSVSVEAVVYSYAYAPRVTIVRAKTLEAFERKYELIDENQKSTFRPKIRLKSDKPNFRKS